MAPLRWGICSAGKISRDFVTAVQTLPTEDHLVVAVAARALDNAKAFAEKFNITSYYGSYEELAKDDNVDIVYVSPIHPEHCRASKLFLTNGKHVLCEKPVAMNSREAEEILQCAKENKKFFMEAVWSRFFPAYARLQTEMEENSIGDINIASASFGFPSSSTPRMSQKELGGGVMLDLGVYVVQFANFVFKENPEKIVASGFRMDSTGVDETVSITLLYSGNRMAQLLVSMSTRLHNKAFVMGTKGLIELPDFWHATKILTPSGTYEYPVPDPDGEYHYSQSSGLAYEANAVHDCIQRGELECPLMTHDDTRMNMSILDEVRRQIGVVYDADKV